MSVHAMAAASEVALAADTIVTSALGQVVEITLPQINDGTGTSVAVGKTYRISNTAGGMIKVLDHNARLVATVIGKSAAVVVARTGLVQSEKDAWNVSPAAHVPSTFLAPGATYAQADSVAIVACLVANGLMNAE